MPAAWTRGPRSHERWLGREVKLIDATGVSMDDTAESREVFGTPTGQKPGCGFPVMKLCALFSLTTGAWLAHESGRTYDHDLSTAVPLLQNHLHDGDVLVGAGLTVHGGSWRWPSCNGRIVCCASIRPAAPTSAAKANTEG